MPKLFMVSSPPAGCRSLAGDDLFDGRHDVGIGAAAADIAAHQLANLIGRVRLPFGDQADGRTDLAGRAISALEGVMFDERLLQWMQSAALAKPSMVVIWRHPS